MVKHNKKIDVIIPAYNVKDIFLFQCLSSIACQSIIDDIEVTIVDDASEIENYQFIADKFKSIMKINIIKRKENGGSGVARQTGIDNTENEYITFIDADDTFNGAYALQALKLGIEKSKVYKICVGNFEEIHYNNYIKEEVNILHHEQDLIWMHGKLYRRDFIENNKIRFHPTSRANEDGGFNRLCKMCLKENEQIIFIEDNVYCWQDKNENSITRRNDLKYSYGSSKEDSFYGLVENSIYIIEEAKKRNIDPLKIKEISINYMISLYGQWLICLRDSEQDAQTNLKYCKDYYNKIYKNMDKTGTEQILLNNYNKIMMGFYERNELDGIIPSITFNDFLKKLENKDNEN